MPRAPDEQPGRIEKRPVLDGYRTTPDTIEELEAERARRERSDRPPPKEKFADVLKKKQTK